MAYCIFFPILGRGGGNQRMDIQSFLNIGYAEFIILDVDKTIQFENKLFEGKKIVIQ